MVQPLSTDEVIRAERELAKYANSMDSIVRIPFTRIGFGADAALSTIPVIGDFAGLVLTFRAITLGRRVGVPWHRFGEVAKWALIDALVGLVPVAGTAMDILIRPSRRALDIVHEHIRVNYDLGTIEHIEHPFLHDSLAKKQEKSAFWRNPVVSWLWLHIPDLIGMIGILGLIWLTYRCFRWFWGWF